jgi:hypothetical protein
MEYIKLFEEIHIHDRWEQQSIEEEDIKQFVETLFVNLLDEGFTVNTHVIYSEYSQDPKKYLTLFIRNPKISTESVVKYSDISNEIQTFIDYIKRKWGITETTYEYEQVNGIFDIKVFKISKEPSLETQLFKGKFNLTITQLDKRPSMLKRFIKRF